MAADLSWTRAATRDDKEVLTRINRKMYDEFPEMRRILLDPLRRNTLHNLLLSLLKHAPEHTLSQCMVRVAREGYTITKATGTEAKESGVMRGSDARDPSLNITAGSQRARLLSAYWNAGEAGLTAQEARDAASLSPKSCYWKRVSELHTAGYLEVMEDDSGNVVRREADTGGKQRVYQITPLGHEIIEELI